MAESDLSALFPVVPVTVGGERLRLRPVVLAELPAVERVVEAWRLLVATGGNSLHSDAWEDFLDLCAAAVERPTTWLNQLSEADFETLICLVLAANEAIWKPEQTPKGTDEPFAWADIVQRLVEHGHDWTKIQGYTLSQARAFLNECFRQENEDLARQVQAASFSMTDPKATSRVVKELKRG